MIRKPWKHFSVYQIILWLASVVAGAVLLIFGTVCTMTDSPASFFRFLSNFHAIRQNYFRPVSDAQLFDGASSGMVEALSDPYSVMLKGKSADQMKEETLGEYGGIGVVLGMSSSGNHFYILHVFPGSTAEQNGLKPGDEIISVDDEDISSMDAEQLAGKIRGKDGTTVSLVIRRDGNDIPFSIIRSNITMPTVQGTMISDDIGYIHIYSFTKHTPDEFRDELKELSDSGMKKLIIDLRMNPGGLVDSVVAVANQILTSGTIVSYHMKDGTDQVFRINGVEHPLPMAVLIDGNSASASEILAGAVQDKQEGTIIGENSYGKGTVQTLLDVGNGEMMKLSIAEYLTAAGRTIDKTGIAPDIPVKQEGQIFDPASDNVLQRAVDELKNK